MTLINLEKKQYGHLIYTFSILLSFLYCDIFISPCILIRNVSLYLQEARKKVNKRLEELRASTESGGAVSDVSRSLVQTGAVNFGDRQQGIVGGTLTNVLVIVGFAAFAWTVKYVLRTISQPE